MEQSAFPNLTTIALMTTSSFVREMLSDIVKMWSMSAIVLLKKSVIMPKTFGPNVASPHHPALLISLLVTMAPNAFPIPKYAMVLIRMLVLIICTRLLHSVKIVLINTFCVRDMAKRFAMQISTDAMESSIAMIEQMKLLHIVIIVPELTFSNEENMAKSFVVQANTNAMAVLIVMVTQMN